MLRSLFVALVLAALAGAGCAQSIDSKDDNFIIYNGHSADMRKAIDKARRTLAAAMEAASLGNTGRFSPELILKVAIPAGDGVENIWVDSIARDSDALVGRFANEPRYLPGKRLGDTVNFSLDAVIDWSLPKSDGKLFGHYTTRIILQNIAPEEARRIRSRLSLRPAPRNW